MRVLEGVDEGVYGWVGLNYAKSHLMPSAGRPPVPPAEPREEARAFRTPAVP